MCVYIHVCAYLIDVLQHPLQLGRLHHDSSSAGAGSGLLQEPPRSLVLSTFTFKFNGRQPYLLAVRVGLECERQNGTSGRHITLQFTIHCVHRNVVHVHVHVYMYTYIHIYIHCITAYTLVHNYIHTCTYYTCVYTCTCMCTR